MKTIGLIGGMSWESTVTYYQVINDTVKEKLGGLHSAKIVLYSVGFAVAERVGVKWLPSDFKKRGGFDRSTELSEQYGLYRQEYCGCEFSLNTPGADRQGH